MCPIFVGSVHKFGRSDGDIFQWQKGLELFPLQLFYIIMQSFKIVDCFKRQKCLCALCHNSSQLKQNSQIIFTQFLSLNCNLTRVSILYMRTQYTLKMFLQKSLLLIVQGPKYEKNISSHSLKNIQTETTQFVSLCIFFEGSVFTFQFLNDKITYIQCYFTRLNLRKMSPFQF